MEENSSHLQNQPRRNILLAKHFRTRWTKGKNCLKFIYGKAQVWENMWLTEYITDTRSTADLQLLTKWIVSFYSFVWEKLGGQKWPSSSYLWVTPCHREDSDVLRLLKQTPQSCPCKGLGALGFGGEGKCKPKSKATSLEREVLLLCKMPLIWTKAK